MLVENGFEGLPAGRMDLYSFENFDHLRLYSEASLAVPQLCQELKTSAAC